MSSRNTITGKGFEFATLRAFADRLGMENQTTEINTSPSYRVAEEAFKSLSENEQKDYLAAAYTAADVIIPLEPNLIHGDAGSSIRLEIQADVRGEEGDVRDLLFIRTSAGWEIGVSCKHNHEDLKHPRITEQMNFGSDWIGYSCSQQFFDALDAPMSIVRKWASENTLWRNHPDLHDVVYVPIVQAFIDEIQRLCDTYPDAPAKLVAYFFGVKDFYKVIAHDIRRAGDVGTTKVEAYNMSGTLGQPYKNIRPITKLKVTKLPTRLIEIRFADGRKTGELSKTSLIMVFDGGWSIKMRLHSADSKVKRTGLKWAVSLVGRPTDVHSQERAWSAE